MGRLTSVALALLAAGSASAASARIVSLEVGAARTPHFSVRLCDTSGTYPQVQGQGLNLGAVNEALRDAILADQLRYAKLARPVVAGLDPRTAPGTYWTGIDRKLMSASTVVASWLWRRESE
jgi:hypothetical protein